MDSVVRYLAIANMFLGCVLVLMQLAMLVTLHDWVDWICIGFWGGGLMILAGMWALQRSQKKMISMAALSIFAGLCMIGFYSWQVNILECPAEYNGTNTRASSWEKDPELCDWRLASDILFIMFGCVTIVLNIFLAARASTLSGARRRSSSSGHHHHAPAAGHSQQPVIHTTYVTTAPAGYPPQQHAYPPQQAGYPAYPQGPANQPPYNPGYPQNYKN